MWSDFNAPFFRQNFGDVNRVLTNELRARIEGAITEPFALPAELQAHITAFSSEKVTKNGFLKYSILAGLSEENGGH